MNLDRTLRVKPKEQFVYLRIPLTNIAVNNIKSIMLRLREGTSPAGNTAFEIRGVEGDWTEEEVNWKTKPKAATVVYGRFNGKIREGEVIDIPLDNFSLQQTGTYNLVLVPVSGNTATHFYASEEGDGPQLVIEYK